MFDLATTWAQRNGYRFLNGHKAYIANAFSADVVLPGSAPWMSAIRDSESRYRPSISWTRMRHGGMCAGLGKNLIDKATKPAHECVIDASGWLPTRAIRWMIRRHPCALASG